MMLPPLTTEKWYVCSSSFSVLRGFSCRNRSLVIARHDEVCGKLLYLTKLSFPPSCIWGVPFIHQGCSISEEESPLGSGGLYTGGDILIRFLWEINTGAIINVIFGDAYTYTYKYEPMDKLLARWEKENKDKQSKNCHEQRKKFSDCLLSGCKSLEGGSIHTL